MMNAVKSRHAWQVPTVAWPGLLLLAALAVIVAAGLADSSLTASAASWHASPGHWWLLILVAPWTEEVIFRLGLQETLLRRWPAQGLASNLITALAFGLVHACARQDAAACALIAPALLMGHLYARHRRVWPCVALHAAMNAAWLLGLGLHP